MRQAGDFLKVIVQHTVQQPQLGQARHVERGQVVAIAIQLLQTGAEGSVKRGQRTTLDREIGQRCTGRETRNRGERVIAVTIQFGH